MATNYFQGKWAILYQGNNKYLSGDENSIAATSSSITPSATFILYANSLEPNGTFQGYVQLQGNMKYIAVGRCNDNSVNNMPGMCQLVASAADTSAVDNRSALTLLWLTEPSLLVNATYSDNELVGNGDGIGIVTYGGYAFWGFYTSDTYSWGQASTTVITPGLYQLTQSQPWPNSDFSFVDLTGQDLSGGYVFQDSNFQRSVLDRANFNGANLSGADFRGACLAGTNLTGATLSGSNFTGCDLTSIVYDGTTVTTATQSAPGIFNSAHLPFTLINRAWQWLDLRNATVGGIPGALSSSSSRLQASGAKLSGMNRNDFSGMTLENAVLDNSLLDGLDLSGVDLTSASLIDASLHGANLSGATLVGTDLTGAQFGSLARLFTLPAGLESALNAGQVSAIAPYFAQNDIALSTTATLDTTVADRVWTLDDAGNDVTYTIRLENHADSTQVLTVYAPTTAASLVNAYMPNAVLTGVNLYGVSANNIQFYGSNARVDGSAILEEAQLNNSNLSGLNLTQARLLGTNLSGSYLFNAKFNGADLTPSANGVAVDLSDANLQGADFTDALLYGATLVNAAVAINTPTSGNPNQGGVYLFSLPYPGDTSTLQDYTAELNAASSQFSLNPNGDSTTLQKYVSALESNNLALLKIAFLEQQPPRMLSQNAQIQTVEGGSVWQIVDQPTTYNLWTDTDENGETELYVAPPLTKTQAAFGQNSITLRWQASTSIDAVEQQWLVDNDSENPQNFSTGYMSFLLKVDGNVLDVYSTAVRILRLGANNQNEFETEECNVTQLGVTNMSGATICPNGATLSANRAQSGENWDECWLRASSLPAPPTCVPTDYNWCPHTQAPASDGDACDDRS